MKTEATEPFETLVNVRFITSQNTVSFIVLM